MIDYIPSKSVKEYLKEKGHVFSDFEKAALIWDNWCSCRGEILDSLRELAAQTTDEKTRVQIEERLCYEEKALDAFMDNQGGKYIYEVTNSGESKNNILFSTCDAAIAYAKRQTAEDNECYTVDKRLLISGDEMSDDLEERIYIIADGGLSKGYLFFDEEGELYRMQLFFEEMSPEDEEKLSNSERFEHKSIEVPHPFEKGDIVWNLALEECYVVQIDDEAFSERKKEDWGILVTYIEEDGLWYSKTISPIYLEIIQPEPERYGEGLCRALEAMSAFLKSGQSSEQMEEMIIASGDYAKG